ncbi:hypothetical protein, partial [Salmonella sp. s55044]|uniref:hypothetical protein n=1 Tax=Salmonella sp. s55044 TaxID=3159677 RepID=UPI00397F1B7E
AYCISEDIQIAQLLQNLDPFDLQYVYRFSCGINNAVAEKIITYLKESNDGQKFAILCFLEQEGNTGHLLQTITDLVAARIVITNEDSKLLQRSTVQIMVLASKKKIPISCLVLDQSFERVENGDIILQSGLVLTSLLSLEKMEIITEE